MDTVCSQIVVTEQGANPLLVKNFKFIKNKVRKCGTVKWVCEKRRRHGCKASCSTKGELFISMYYPCIFFLFDIFEPLSTPLLYKLHTPEVISSHLILLISGETSNLLDHNPQHNHDPDEKKYSVQAISNSC